MSAYNTAHSHSTLTPGVNCWRTARADRMSPIIDGEDYFRAVRAAMLNAKRRIFLIGWDFDTRITLDHGEDVDGPRALGPFLSWLAERRPELDVYILRWDMGALKAMARGGAVSTLWRWLRSKRIHMRFDSAHPAGASHHQKIVVVDDSLAFCGGIDMLCDRWDSRSHPDEAPDRRVPGHKPCGPWHDATTVLTGPAAADLGELCRERWTSAGGEDLSPIDTGAPDWPDSVAPQFTDIDIAICRTWPRTDDAPSVQEIERLYLDHIAAARRFIYAESQYFASRAIAEAVARRLEAPDGPEIVLINPLSADGWLEAQAMDSARARLVEALNRIDHQGRFRIFHPYTSAGAPIYVHAKIFIADDAILRVGSSNMNNRSMRLDTECDISLDARANGMDEERAQIRALRESLMAEHLGVEPAEVRDAVERHGGLIAAIDQLRRLEGRTLVPYQVPNLPDVKAWLADNEILDPEGPEETFEPIAKRGLFRRSAMPRP